MCADIFSVTNNFTKYTLFAIREEKEDMGAVKAFANRIKSMRESAGLSQSQLADALGVSRGSISYYENGERTPDVEFLARIREFFQVDYEYLLGESEFKNAVDRADFERSMAHLSPAKSACIMYFHKQLIECAEAYEGHDKLDYCQFFEMMTSDLLTFIEAYKAIVYDVPRYESLTLVKRFLDKIIHTNYPDVLHRLSQGFSSGEVPANDDSSN